MHNNEVWQRHAAEILDVMRLDLTMLDTGVLSMIIHDDEISIATRQAFKRIAIKYHNYYLANPAKAA